MIDDLRFTIPEILSLIGLTQCIYIQVYMLFRAGAWRQICLPFLYFFVLGTAFFLDFAAGVFGGHVGYYDVMIWAAWFMGPPLSVLLVIQIARIHRCPELKYFIVLLFLPAAYFIAITLAKTDDSCKAGLFACDVFMQWLVVAGGIAGLISILFIWMSRGVLDSLYKEKAGKDRYWVILTLVAANMVLVGMMFLGVTIDISPETLSLIRTILGLGLVYLAGTSLFRIYPQALDIVVRQGTDDLSAEDIAIARQIESLMAYEKIYLEAGYSRTDLARELDRPETTISRITNLYFGKSLPQLLNEKRVEEAKKLLAETDAPTSVVAGEVGFNSTASFNRVFRALTGFSPGSYRKQKDSAN